LDPLDGSGGRPDNRIRFAALDQFTRLGRAGRDNGSPSLILKLQNEVIPLERMIGNEDRLRRTGRQAAFEDLFAKYAQKRLDHQWIEPIARLLMQPGRVGAEILDAADVHIAGAGKISPGGI
jgi:hypothetical protein